MKREKPDALLYTEPSGLLLRRSMDGARPGVVNGLGVWWRKLGPRGTNVNELSNQRLTDLGRGPTFYDCAVQVEKCAA